MTTTAAKCILALLMVIGGAFSVAAAEEATPTPTPAAKDGDDLSSVAGQITLNKDAVGSGGPIVISNENLSDVAKKGNVTEVTKPGNQKGRRALADVQGSGAGIEGEAAGYAETAERKQYWQSVYKQQIESLKAINAQIEVLDQEIPGLWRDFYSWDDPAYRDGVIKPKLDDALARRQELEIDRQNGEQRLDEIKEQARREGGEPGWFRGLGSVPTPKPTVGVMMPD